MTISIIVRHLGPSTHPGGSPQTVHGKEGPSVHEGKSVFVKKGTTVDTLIKAGGYEWKKGNLHRVYFDGLSLLYGVTEPVSFQHEIQSVKVDGEKLEGQEADALIRDLGYTEFFYDVKGKKFEVNFLQPPSRPDNPYLERLKAGLKKKVEALK